MENTADTVRVPGMRGDQADLIFHSVFWGSFFPGLEGFEEVTDFDSDIFRLYAPDVAAFLEAGHKPGETVICTGKIKHVGSTYVDQFKHLASLVAPEEVKNVKLTLAAPNWYHLRYKNGRAFPKDVYSTEDEYLSDIAKAYQEELQILYDAGCRNVQFDDPNLACKNPGYRMSLTAQETSNPDTRLLLGEDAGGMEGRSSEHSHCR